MSFNRNATRLHSAHRPLAGLLLAFIVLLVHSLPLTAADARAPQRVTPIDRIVAVVNNEVITQFELNDKLKVVEQQLRKQGTPLPPSDVLQKQLLERMITDKAQLQFARDTGISIDDAQLDKTLQHIAQDSNMPMEKFRSTLEKEGVSFAKFREDIRNEITLAQLRQREVDNRISVSDSEIDAHLGTQATQLGNETEYELAYIMIQIPEQASPEQIQEKKTRAEQALSQLKKGTDFRQVAAAFSDAPNAMQGGMLGWRSETRLPSLYVDAIKSLHAGEISAILRSPNGFHILKLLDKRGRDVPYVVQQTHARHILLKTNELTAEADAKNRMAQIRERLVNGADFAELARLHSEDGSAAKGGDLGWLSPGDTVPEFERAMDALKVGEISAPIRSPFGWHLIQVLERRNEDVSKERQRLLARREIRERKADEAYQEWVRQLRDRAYIEYHLEDQ